MKPLKKGTVSELSKQSVTTSSNVEPSNVYNINMTNEIHMGNKAFLRTKEAKLEQKKIKNDLDAFKKVNDPNYFLNTEAVANDINSAFTSSEP